MKYLILEDFSGQPVSFLFPNRVDHVDMNEQLPYGKVLSAGFVCFQNGKFECSGGSQELDRIARPQEDAAILEAAFRAKN